LFCFADVSPSSQLPFVSLGDDPRFRLLSPGTAFFLGPSPTRQLAVAAWLGHSILALSLPSPRFTRDLTPSAIPYHVFTSDLPVRVFQFSIFSQTLGSSLLGTLSPFPAPREFATVYLD